MKTSEANIEDLKGMVVSDGTMRSEDLIPKFLNVLKVYGKDVYDKYVGENPEVLDLSGMDDETMGWVVDELFDKLNEIAPEGYSFGSQDGDGACYGFWSVDADERKKCEAYIQPVTLYSTTRYDDAEAVQSFLRDIGGDSVTVDKQRNGDVLSVNVSGSDDDVEAFVDTYKNEYGSIVKDCEVDATGWTAPEDIYYIATEQGRKELRGESKKGESAGETMRVDVYADRRNFDPEEFVKYVRKAGGKDGGYISVDSVVSVDVLNKANRLAQANDYKRTESKKSEADGDSALKKMQMCLKRYKDKSIGEIAADIRYDVATALDMPADAVDDAMQNFGLDNIYIMRSKGMSPKVIAQKILATKNTESLDPSIDVKGRGVVELSEDDYLKLSRDINSRGYCKDKDGAYNVWIGGSFKGTFPSVEAAADAGYTLVEGKRCEAQVSEKTVKQGVDEFIGAAPEGGWSDYWAMQQDWEFYKDSLCRDGVITQKQADSWSNPCTPDTFDRWQKRNGLVHRGYESKKSESADGLDSLVGIKDVTELEKKIGSMGLTLVDSGDYAGNTWGYAVYKSPSGEYVQYDFNGSNDVCRNVKVFKSKQNFIDAEGYDPEKSESKKNEEKILFKDTEIPNELKQVYNACKKRFYCEPNLVSMVDSSDNGYYKMDGSYGSDVKIRIEVGREGSKFIVSVDGLDETTGYHWETLGTGESENIKQAIDTAMAEVDKNLMPFATKIHKAIKGESNKGESLYGRSDSEKDELAGKYYVDIEDDSEGTIYSSKQEFGDYSSAEEWANSELKKNADDEDVFKASIYKMFVDTDTDQLDSDLEGVILKSDACESKKSESKKNEDTLYMGCHGFFTKDGKTYVIEDESPEWDGEIVGKWSKSDWERLDTDKVIREWRKDHPTKSFGESKKSESLTLKQKELKDMARFGQAEDITTISDAEAKELKKKGIETVGISRGVYGMNGALLRDSEGKKYVITARSSNLFYFV